MIEVSTETIYFASKMRILKCPHCKARLCDVPVTPSDQDKITLHENSNIDLMIKCARCGCLIGIKVI